MILLYYIIGSVILGVVPAIIAMQKKRNFFIWWLYGALFLPAALLHSILLVLKLKKGMGVAYTLVILQGLGIFYFAAWFLTTQPLSIRQAEISEAKYKVAKLILDNRDAITAGSISDFRAYVIGRTELQEKNVEAALEYFDDSLLSDKKKLTAFALDLLTSINKIFNFISQKGAFEELTVPMGAASDVFSYYIESLVLLNEHLSDDTPTVEANLESILSTEQTYFKTTKYAGPFIEHLDAESKKEISRDRQLAIIDHYLSIGKILTLNEQRQEAKRCNDSAIALYDRILADPGLEPKERESFLFRIAEAHDKNRDAENIVRSLEKYVNLVFASTLYADRDTADQVRKFVRLDTIIGRHENLVKVLQTFMSLSEKYKKQYGKEVAGMQNSILTTIFTRLSSVERNRYSRAIDENYKILIGTDDIESLGIVKEAFTFFEDSMYPGIADFYMATAKRLFTQLLEVEQGVVADYTALAEKVSKMNERVSGIIETEPALTAKEKAELRQGRADVEAEMKRLETVNGIVKTGRGIIADMADPKASQDETFRVESGTRDAVRELYDNFSVIEDRLE